MVKHLAQSRTPSYCGWGSDPGGRLLGVRSPLPCFSVSFRLAGATVFKVGIFCFLFLEEFILGMPHGMGLGALLSPIDLLQTLAVSPYSLCNFGQVI